MTEILLILCLSTALVAFFLCLYAHRRVTKIQESTKDLDWSALSNITGDLATLKKTIQTLNSRLNGMHSPKVQDEEILRYMANQQVANRNLNNATGG
jgi:ABC-type phosphate transport system auxiliary subunit